MGGGGDEREEREERGARRHTSTTVGNVELTAELSPPAVAQTLRLLYRYRS